MSQDPENEPKRLPNGGQMAPKSGPGPPGTLSEELSGNSLKNDPKWMANGKPNGGKLGAKIDEKMHAKNQ